MNAVSDVTRMTLPASPAAAINPSSDGEISRLYAALDRVSWAANPRTAKLLASGLRKKSQKIVEEAAEVSLEAVRHRTDATVRESADLLYHLVVLWHECGIRPEQIWAEMAERAGNCGIAEKLPKPPGRTSSTSSNSG